MTKPSARVVTTTIDAPPRTWEQAQAANTAATPARYIGPRITHDELAVLRAKAVVCDAYRVWLSSTSKQHRLVVCDALERLAKIEDAVADRGKSSCT